MHYSQTCDYCVTEDEMAGKDLRKLSKTDLLELLIEQGRENLALKARLEEVEAELAHRRLTMEQSGSIAEAALKLSGVFERIGGLILGKHEKFDDLGTGRMPHEILQEVMGQAAFPVLAQFDCCHTHPMLTLPIGTEVMLDADARQLILCESFISA